MIKCPDDEHISHGHGRIREPAHLMGLLSARMMQEVRLLKIRGDGLDEFDILG